MENNNFITILSTDSQTMQRKKLRTFIYKHPEFNKFLKKNKLVEKWIKYQMIYIVYMFNTHLSVAQDGLLYPTFANSVLYQSKKPWIKYGYKHTYNMDEDYDPELDKYFTYINWKITELFQKLYSNESR